MASRSNRRLASWPRALQPLGRTASPQGAPSNQSRGTIGRRSLVRTPFFVLVILTFAAFIAAFTGPLAPPSHAAAPALVEVRNANGVLSDEESDALIRDTKALDFPTAGIHVVYIVSSVAPGKGDGDSAKSQYDDWIKEQAQQSNPPLANVTKFSDDTLIISLDTNARKYGIYLGENLKEPLNTNEHLIDDVDAMQPYFKNADWRGGLLEGAKVTASRGEALESKQSFGQMLLKIAGVVVLVGAIGAAGVAVFSFFLMRKPKRKKAHAAYNTLTSSYAEVAQSLDSADIRANSLTSPLLNAELRHQWRTTRDSFLGVHEVLSRIPDAPSDKTLVGHYEELIDAQSHLTAATTAAENIDTLFELEHGSRSVRYKEMLALIRDAKEARASTHGSSLRQGFDDIIVRMEQLKEDPKAPDFMERYIAILDDYRPLLDELHRREFKEYTPESEPPSIASKEWHPGVGYGGYTPFTWFYASAVAPATESSSSSSWSVSSSSASFSGGFSGTGASGSF